MENNDDNNEVENNINNIDDNLNNPNTNNNINLHPPTHNINNNQESLVMEDFEETSRFALKIVLILSILLVSMDISEVYFTFLHLEQAILTYQPEIFESCIKYHIISQIIFTLFATFAGISACFMSIGLLIDYEFFANKLINTFLYMNYLIFGPYLLSASLMGYINFNNVVYNCQNGNLTLKYLNVSSLVALNICFLISIIITVSFSFFKGFMKMVNSIRFSPNGNFYLGKLFWWYILNRNRDDDNNTYNSNINSNINNNDTEREMNNLPPI